MSGGTWNRLLPPLSPLSAFTFWFCHNLHLGGCTSFEYMQMISFPFTIMINFIVISKRGQLCIKYNLFCHRITVIFATATAAGWTFVHELDQEEANYGKSKEGQITIEEEREKRNGGCGGQNYQTKCSKKWQNGIEPSQPKAEADLGLRPPVGAATVWFHWAESPEAEDGCHHKSRLCNNAFYCILKAKGKAESEESL